MTSSRVNFMVRPPVPDPDGDVITALFKAAHDLRFCITVSDGQSCLLYRSGDYAAVFNSMPVLGMRILTFSHAERSGELVGSISVFWNGDLTILTVSTDNRLINQMFVDANFPV